MIDYYGLPASGHGAWPGRADASLLAFKQKAACVESAILKEISREVDSENRFVPFVVMHEFEALLFADCEALSRGIGRPLLHTQFQSVRERFSSPEEINDSPDKAPSKRIESIVSGYEKPFLGILAALEIGLVCMRANCPHFNNWLRQLESIPQTSG